MIFMLLNKILCQLGGPNIKHLQQTKKDKQQSTIFSSWGNILYFIKYLR